MEDNLPEYQFDGEKLILSEEEWNKRLTLKQFSVLRKQGTEPPFNNAYYDNKEPGIYKCAACALPLFSSRAKFDSGTGWPSFFVPIFPENVSFKEDQNLLTARTEVLCSRCYSHLGHVFPDGPKPTKQRFCINSTALQFTAKQK